MSFLMRRMSTESSLGCLVARTMAGAWRQAPEPLTISDAEVSQIAPLLLATGTAALAWRRIESSDLHKRVHFLILRMPIASICSMQPFMTSIPTTFSVG